MRARLNYSYGTQSFQCRSVPVQIVMVAKLKGALSAVRQAAIRIFDDERQPNPLRLAARRCLTYVDLADPTITALEAAGVDWSATSFNTFSLNPLLDALNNVTSLYEHTTSAFSETAWQYKASSQPSAVQQQQQQDAVQQGRLLVEALKAAQDQLRAFLNHLEKLLAQEEQQHQQQQLAAATPSAVPAAPNQAESHQIYSDLLQQLRALQTIEFVSDDTDAGTFKQHLQDQQQQQQQQMLQSSPISPTLQQLALIVQLLLVLDSIQLSFDPSYQPQQQQQQRVGVSESEVPHGLGEGTASQASNQDHAATTTASSSCRSTTSATGTAATAAVGQPRGILALGRGFGAAPGASAASMQYSSTARRAAAAAGGVRGPLLAPPAATAAAARRLVATSAVATAAPAAPYARQLQPKADLMQQQQQQQQQELQQGVSTQRPEMCQHYGLQQQPQQQQERGINIQDILQQQQQQYQVYGGATSAPAGAAYPLQLITAVRLSPFAIRTAPLSSASAAAGAVAAAAAAASGPCVELQVLLPQLSSLPAAVAWECRLR